jgi:basic amino acid/polyamine antiporter, APA family
VPKLLRRLGARDAALIVMGGIIGSGIFRNPSVVAKFAPSAVVIMAIWAIGGGIALLGGAVFAELAARRPRDGGLYAYMRDAFHPVIAFMYGWTLLLVSQSGGMAAAAVTFAGYVTPWLGLHASEATAERVLALMAIAIFTVVNALGVRQGTNAQNAFMIVKIAAIAGFVAVGLFAPHAPAAATAASSGFVGGSVIAAMGLAMVPVLFSYSGWQTSSFMSAELKDPHVTLPRGMIIGVVTVVVLYLAVNAVSLRALGVDNLAATNAPATAIAQLAFGQSGAVIITVVVALSTLGFLSNQILTSPRVYFQMAADGTFFKQLATVSPRTHVPVLAIVAQGAVAGIITLSGAYDQILNYVTTVDYIFFGLSAIALIVFRNRDKAVNAPKPFYVIPGHPFTTVLFLAIAWTIVGDVLIKSPGPTVIGLAILFSGIPVYWLFTRGRKTERAPA